MDFDSRFAIAIFSSLCPQIFFLVGSTFTAFVDTAGALEIPNDKHSHPSLYRFQFLYVIDCMRIQYYAGILHLCTVEHIFIAQYICWCFSVKSVVSLLPSFSGSSSLPYHSVCLHQNMFSWFHFIQDDENGWFMGACF